VLESAKKKRNWDRMLRTSTSHDGSDDGGTGGDRRDVQKISNTREGYEAM
jgi:hypothetical protein